MSTRCVWKVLVGVRVYKLCPRVSVYGTVVAAGALPQAKM